MADRILLGKRITWADLVEAIGDEVIYEWPGDVESLQRQVAITGRHPFN